MKKLILIFAFACAMAACTKQSDSVNSRYSAQVQSDPGISSYIVTKVAEAGGDHPKFTVTLNIPDSLKVKKINLYRVPLLLRWTVNNPRSTTYIMYDHVSEYPSWTQSIYYNFEFEMTDGRKIELDPFWVY